MLFESHEQTQGTSIKIVAHDSTLETTSRQVFQEPDDVDGP